MCLLIFEPVVAWCGSKSEWQFLLRNSQRQKNRRLGVILKLSRPVPTNPGNLAAANPRSEQIRPTCGLCTDTSPNETESVNEWELATGTYKFASNAKLIDNKEVEAFGFDSLISQYKSDGKRESGRAKSLTVDVISRTTIKGQLDLLIMLSDFWSACLSNFLFV